MVTKGGIPWNKGIKISAQHRENIRKCRTGTHLSEETKQKISTANKGERNGNWNGDIIPTRAGLHQWVRRHLPEPDLCELCNKVPPYDLANITGVYNRDFNNWKYYCRRCHVHSDDRLEKAYRIRKILSLMRPDVDGIRYGKKSGRKIKMVMS